VIIIRKNLLTYPGGFIIAALITLILFLLSPIIWIGLTVFFLSSSLLSKWKTSEKFVINQEFAKKSQRDIIQVLANSVIALLFSILYFINDVLPALLEGASFPLITKSSFIIAAFIAISTHNADTWMTEIGITTKSTPRLIINLRKEVQKGTSGGITPFGTFAGVIGALIISLIYTISSIMFSEIPLNHVLINTGLILVGGLAGGLIDSLEGATIQKIYYCDYCQKETETNPHRCGKPTKGYRGLNLITNDIVNLTSALLSAIFFSIISNFFI